MMSLSSADVAFLFIRVSQTHGLLNEMVPGLTLWLTRAVEHGLKK